MLSRGRLVLLPHEGLRIHSRVPETAAEHSCWLAVALLLASGMCAALATAWLDLGLHIPGYAIARAMLPMCLGLALAPRRGAGMVMGGGALVTAFSLQATGRTSLGVGALTSLLLMGPFLDFALRRAERGWHVYMGLGLAGMAGNLVALATRTIPKLAGLDRPGARTLDDWLPEALVTYPLCGLAAGLLGAVVLFQLGRPPRRRPERS